MHYILVSIQLPACCASVIVLQSNQRLDDKDNYLDSRHLPTGQVTDTIPSIASPSLSYTVQLETLLATLTRWHHQASQAVV